MTETAKRFSRTANDPYDRADLRLQLTLYIFLCVGAFFTLANLRWPIARNALCYAKATLGLLQHHFNVLAVAHDSAWTSGKPILFALVAAGFARVVSLNTAVITASFIGTAFYVWMVALALPRLNRRCRVDRQMLPLEFVLVACNALTIYQFWSGYPDTIFAGLVLLAFVLIDIRVTGPERDTRWHIIGLGLTSILAIHTKLCGAVLVPMCLIYLAYHSREFLRCSSHLVSKVALFLAACGTVTGILIAAKFNRYPLLMLSDGGGFSAYVGGIEDPVVPIIRAATATFFLTIVLAFHVSLISLLTRAAWRATAFAPIIFAAFYVLGLLPFPGTSYNMRYFLPTFPFLAPMLAAGLNSLDSVRRHLLVGAYAAVAFLLILNFNFASAERAFQPMASAILAKHPRINGRLDNLRLPVQMAIRGQIDAVNSAAQPGSVLYWSSNYYGTATHGLAEYLGVRKDLDIRYVLSPVDVPASPQDILLVQFTARKPECALHQLLGWAVVKTLAPGVFRLDPK